jgi:hypothetical protein
MATVNVPPPPVAATIGVVAVNVGTQWLDDGAVTLVVDDDPQLAPHTHHSMPTTPIARRCQRRQDDRGENTSLIGPCGKKR